MSIGTFGPVTFEAAEKKVRTFDEFKRTTSAKYEEHAVIGAKPLLEFLAPGLDAVTFQMVFSAALGLNPAKEAQTLRDIVQKHQYYPLIIGSKSLGNFVAEQLTETWRHVDNRGNPLHIAMDVTLKEYIESPATTASGKSGAIGANTTALATVTDKVQVAGSGIGLSSAAISGMSEAALTANRSSLVASSTLSGVFGGVASLQNIAAAISTARNRDVSGLLGQNAAAYQNLGINVTDLVNGSVANPGGAIVSVLDGIQGSKETGYMSAKQLYGTALAGPVMQLAQQLDKVKAALKG